MAHLPIVDAGPGRPGHAGLNSPDRPLPLPPRREPAPVGDHHPAQQGGPGRRPQGPRPRRPHRPRGSPQSHEGHRAGPRKGPETPHCAGQAHRQRQAPLADGKKQESAHRASWRGRVDLALLSVLRDGLLRRSEAHLLKWADVDFRDNGTALLQLHRSKTDQEAEGTAVHRPRRRAAAPTLQAIRSCGQLYDANLPVFGLSPQQIGRRVKAAAKAAGQGEGFTGHSGRVGMAQDLASTGTEMPALMTAGRWKNSKMPARYTERQAAGRSAVAKCYQEKNR